MCVYIICIYPSSICLSIYLSDCVSNHVYLPLPSSPFVSLYSSYRVHLKLQRGILEEAAVITHTYTNCIYSNKFLKMDMHGVIFATEKYHMVIKGLGMG